MYHLSAEKLSATSSERRSESAVSSIDIWSETWECKNGMQACNVQQHVWRNIRCNGWSTTSRYCQQVAFNIVKFMVWQFFSDNIGKIKDTLRYATSLRASCTTYLQKNSARHRQHVAQSLQSHLYKTSEGKGGNAKTACRLAICNNMYWETFATTDDPQPPDIVSKSPSTSKSSWFDRSSVNTFLSKKINCDMTQACMCHVRIDKQHTGLQFATTCANTYSI